MKCHPHILCWVPSRGPSWLSKGADSPARGGKHQQGLTVLPLWNFHPLHVSWAMIEGAHQLTAGPCCSSGKKGTLAAIPGTLANKSEFSATSCLAYCPCTSSAVAKLSVCWAEGGMGAGVINPLNASYPGFHPEKLGSKMTPGAGGGGLVAWLPSPGRMD